MENCPAELLSEISQLVEQYRREVPGRRRAWPESIKQRVVGLRRFGLNYSQIAKQTGIAYFTVLGWRNEKKSPSFEPVAVVATRRAARPTREVGTVTVPTRTPKVATRTVPTPNSDSTVTVRLPSGVHIEGMSLEFLLELLPKLGVRVQ